MPRYDDTTLDRLLIGIVSIDYRPREDTARRRICRIIDHVFSHMALERVRADHTEIARVTLRDEAEAALPAVLVVEDDGTAFTMLIVEQRETSERFNIYGDRVDACYGFPERYVSAVRRALPIILEALCTIYPSLQTFIDNTCLVGDPTPIEVSNES